MTQTARASHNMIDWAGFNVPLNTS